MISLKFLLTKSWLVFVVVVAAAGVGGGAYAAWTASLHVEGTIQTGSVDVVWDMQDDQESVGILNPTTGQVVDQPIPAGKDVADCVSSLQPGETAETVTFRVVNAYPSYTCTITLGGIVNGSVPVHINDIQIMATDRLTGADVLDTEMNVNVLLTRKFPDDNSETGFVCDRQQPVVINTQLHRGDRFCAIISVHATMDAQQNHDYLGGVWIDLIQWNFAGTQPAPTLPVLNVVAQGISQAQADTIAEALGLTAADVQVEDGVVSFIDPVAFQAVPMTSLALSDEILAETEVDDTSTELEGLALNFEEIKKIVAFNPEEALAKTQTALGRGQAIPVFGLPSPGHTMFEAVDAKGSELAKVAIDTNVAFPQAVRTLPLIGPGAQIKVTYSPAGDVTQLHHSSLGLAPGAEMEIIPTAEAVNKCNLLYPGLGADIKPTMAYYAPPLALQPNMILPHYDCQGTAESENGSLNVLQNLLPAVDDPKFVPQISLTGSFNGQTINASADVTGGRPPYTYHWTSLLDDLSGVPEDANSVEYGINPRLVAGNLQVQTLLQENLRLVVVDSNGIQSVDNVLISLSTEGIEQLTFLGDWSETGGGGSKLARPLNVGGTTDFGIERAVSDMCSSNVNRYGDIMDNEAFKRFHWTGTNAWERDFKAGSAHNSMVDNVDEAFYCGHGWSGGFTFEGNSDDGSVVTTDPLGSPGGDWGDSDLEWMAILSCQVMKLDAGGVPLWQRWGPAFDGLHLMLGFHTNAYDWSNFGKKFAQYQTGQGKPLLPVRAAWFQAAAEEQPNNVTSVVMGIVGPNGWSNYNDYFWGQGGSTGPDLRGSNIQGYWWQWQTN